MCMWSDMTVFLMSAQLNVLKDTIPSHIYSSGCSLYNGLVDLFEIRYAFWTYNVIVHCIEEIFVAISVSFTYTNMPLHVCTCIVYVCTV